MNGDDPRLVDFLDHMLEAIRRMRVYTQDLTAAEFSHNTLVQDGVIRNIEILGEAARNIERAYPEFARQHPEVPWGLGLRNAQSRGARILHG